MHSLLRFDLSSIPAGAVVTEATLTLYCAQVLGAGEWASLRLAPASSTWSESTVTWNNQPGTAGSPSTSTQVSGTAYVAYNLNVTAFVEDWLDGTLANHGFRLEMNGIEWTPPEDLTAVCRSSEYDQHYEASYRPQLVVNYTTPGTTPIVRSYYGLAGQMIAVRVANDPTPGNNGLWQLHSDHLGSSRLMSDSAGAAVTGSTTRFLPYGGYRTTPSNGRTDRGFTGHQQQDELGLIYMRARWFVPAVGRFASADTIVPEPANPQSHNRFSYVRNNPLRFTDPTGHWLCEEDCSTYTPPPPPPQSLIDFEGDWSDEEKATIEGAARLIAIALAQNDNQGLTPSETFLAVYGGRVTFNRTGASCESVYKVKCYGSASAHQVNVYTNADGNVAGNTMWVLHELGHSFNANAIPAGADKGQPYVDLSNPIVVGGVPITPTGGRPRTHDGYQWGEGGVGDRTPYQNSWDDLAVGEDYADMFANWATDDFADNIYGNARYNWMDSRMSGWIALAVAHNQ